MWNKGWDKVFEKTEWGKYPSEELIRFMARNFYNVPNRGDIKVLEVGSGTGANLWYLAKEGFDATGIDGSRAGVDRSVKRLKEESLKASVLVGDVMNLPFENGRFDCVVDLECIYANNYGDSKIIMDEVCRVLKPAGKFFSKTFMVGTSGDGHGRKLEGEENTYVELDEGAFRKDCALTRFTSEKEIDDLYGTFCIESIDYTVRTERNRKLEIKEWIIVCSKRVVAGTRQIVG